MTQTKKQELLQKLFFGFLCLALMGVIAFFVVKLSEPRQKEQQRIENMTVTVIGDESETD